MTHDDLVPWRTCCHQGLERFARDRAATLQSLPANDVALFTPRRQVTVDVRCVTQFSNEEIRLLEHTTDEPTQRLPRVPTRRLSSIVAVVAAVAATVLVGLAATQVCACGQSPPDLGGRPPAGGSTPAVGPTTPTRAATPAPNTTPEHQAGAPTSEPPHPGSSTKTNTPPPTRPATPTRALLH